MDTRKALLATLALGAAASLSAFGGPDGPRGPRPDGPPPRGCPRDSLRHPRPAPKLTDEQKAFLESERALRDSMHRAVRAYADTVRAGADPRSLPVSRARINDFARRLERLRAENLEVWLDLQALRPGPGPHHPPRGPRAPGDSLPPPPPDGAEPPQDAPPPPDAD